MEKRSRKALLIYYKIMEDNYEEKTVNSNACHYDARRGDGSCRLFTARRTERQHIVRKRRRSGDEDNPFDCDTGRRYGNGDVNKARRNGSCADRRLFVCRGFDGVVYRYGNGKKRRQRNNAEKDDRYRERRDGSRDNCRR